MRDACSHEYFCNVKCCCNFIQTIWKQKGGISISIYTSVRGQTVCLTASHKGSTLCFLNCVSVDAEHDCLLSET
jgi:hypothetical protein